MTEKKKIEGVGKWGDYSYIIKCLLRMKPKFYISYISER